MNILIDFDGTVVDSAKTIIEDYKKEFGKDFRYDPKDLKWDFSPYANTMEEFTYCINRFSEPTIYERSDIIDGFNLKKFIDWCHSHGHKVILCSKRNIGSFDICVKFLEDRGLDFDDYCFVSTFDKSIVGGSNDVIIDDQVRCMCGRRSHKILFGDYGYQKDMKLDGIVRAKNWADVLAYMKSQTVQSIDFEGDTNTMRLTMEDGSTVVRCMFSDMLIDEGITYDASQVIKSVEYDKHGRLNFVLTSDEKITV